MVSCLYRYWSSHICICAVSVISGSNIKHRSLFQYMFQPAKSLSHQSLFAGRVLYISKSFLFKWIINPLNHYHHYIISHNISHYSTTFDENFIPIHQMVNHMVLGGQNSLFNDPFRLKQQRRSFHHQQGGYNQSTTYRMVSWARDLCHYSNLSDLTCTMWGPPVMLVG